MKTQDRRPAQVPQVVTRNIVLPVSLRDAGDDGASLGKLVGYAAKFDVESCPLWDPCVGDLEFVEVIRPGAFARTLRENPDIRALYNHDTSVVLGRTKAGTLRLSEDATGLAFEVDLPATQAARDVRELVRVGNIDGCSFGFMVIDDAVEQVGDRLIRTLIDVELFEISPAVAFPAYESSEVALRHRAAPGRARSTPRLNLARNKLRRLDA